MDPSIAEGGGARFGGGGVTSASAVGIVMGATFGVTNFGTADGLGSCRDALTGADADRGITGFAGLAAAALGFASIELPVGDLTIP
jgi:hypothetical protein